MWIGPWAIFPQYVDGAFTNRIRKQCVCAVNFIEYVLSVFLCEWVWATLCTTSTVQDYVLHHGAQGRPMSVRSRVHHRHFSFFGGQHGTCTWNGHFLSVSGGTQEHTCPYVVGHKNIQQTQVVHNGIDTEYSHSVVHNVHTNQGSQCSSVRHTLWWCTM